MCIHIYIYICLLYTYIHGMCQAVGCFPDAQPAHPSFWSPFLPVQVCWLSHYNAAQSELGGVSREAFCLFKPSLSHNI